MVDRRERRRAGRRVKIRIRSEIKRAIIRNVRLLTLIFVGWLLLGGSAVTILLLTGRSHAAAFFAGLLVGILLLLWHHFLLGQGIAQRQMGAEAEEWTAEVLAKLPSPPWRVFHDVPLEYSNVDHVVVGPGRIYAIETKWTGSGGAERFLKPAARQAERQARELAGRLADSGCVREVLPVLVVWGGGVADGLGDKPRLWEGTRVVAGHHSEVWLHRMVSAAGTGVEDLDAQTAMRQLIDVAAGTPHE
jgi:hypothetical protein